MARQLEPLLWRRFPHTQTGGGALESQDVDLDLAANEGIQILGVDFTIPTQHVAVEHDFEAVLIARPSAEDSLTTMPEALADSDFVCGIHFDSALLTSGAWGAFHERDWRPPGDGLTIARRMTLLFDCDQAAAQIHTNIWYKRLIFSNDEMLGLIIRRR